MHSQDSGGPSPDAMIQVPRDEDQHVRKKRASKSASTAKQGDGGRPTKRKVRLSVYFPFMF